MAKQRKVKWWESDPEPAQPRVTRPVVADVKNVKHRDWRELRCDDPEWQNLAADPAWDIAPEWAEWYTTDWSGAVWWAVEPILLPFPGILPRYYRVRPNEYSAICHRATPKQFRAGADDVAIPLSIHRRPRKEAAE